MVGGSEVFDVAGGAVGVDHHPADRIEDAVSHSFVHFVGRENVSGLEQELRPSAGRGCGDSSSAVVKRGSMSTGTADELVERLSDGRPHHAQPIAERFGLRVVALGLDRHDVARQPGDAVLDLRRSTRERAVRPRPEAALVEQVVQLDGDAAAVRLVDAEADRSERRRQKRRVQRALERLRQHALVDHVLDREQRRRCRPSLPRGSWRLPSSPAAPSSGGRRR